MNTAVQEIPLGEAYQQFKRYKKVQNLSERSLQYYDYCMKYFNEFFSSERLCSEITEDVYMQFIEHLQKRETLKDVTINSYLRGIRVILYFCMEKGFMETFHANLIKADKTIKDVYTDSELNILLKKPKMENCTFVEYRTWVMTNTFVGTGMRLSSLLNLKIEDVDFENYEFHLKKVKNRKQQLVPFSDVLAQILKEYLVVRNGEKEDYLFPNQFGGQLQRHSAECAVQKYNKKRGVEKTSIHLYRHCFAKHWILNGGDIFTLQKMLGHSTLDMVRVYVDLYGHDVKLKYNRFNPLDSFYKDKNRNSGPTLKMPRC